MQLMFLTHKALRYIKFKIQCSDLSFISRISFKNAYIVEDKNIVYIHIDISLIALKKAQGCLNLFTESDRQ